MKITIEIKDSPRGVNVAVLATDELCTRSEKEMAEQLVDAIHASLTTGKEGCFQASSCSGHVAAHELPRRG